MTGEIVNLRRARKAKAREEAEREAGRNRVLHGRTREERARDDAERARQDQARARLEESAERDPRTTSALETLGNLARAAGDWDGALARYREAHRRATEFRDDADRLKFRRFLDVVAREKEAAARGAAGEPRRR